MFGLSIKIWVWSRTEARSRCYDLAGACVCRYGSSSWMCSRLCFRTWNVPWSVVGPGTLRNQPEPYNCLCLHSIADMPGMDVQLTDRETQILVPNIVERSGHNILVIRESMQELLRPEILPMKQPVPSGNFQSGDSSTQDLCMRRITGTSASDAAAWADLEEQKAWLPKPRLATVAALHMSTHVGLEAPVSV